jgi:hypothetical protein
MPIVDIYLLAILGAALWLARGAGDRAAKMSSRRRNAAIALTLMAMNYGLRSVSHAAALQHSSEVFGNRLPGWCAQSVKPDSWTLDHWPRFPGGDSRNAGAARCLVEVAAVPEFISPFRWRLIAQLSNGYEVRDLDLLTGRGLSRADTIATRTLAVRVPNQWTPAVSRAAQADVAQVFLGFSRFPAARSFVAEDGTATVRWSDVRFIQGALDDPRQFRRGLFGTTVVLAPDGRIRESRLGP